MHCDSVYFHLGEINAAYWIVDLTSGHIDELRAEASLFKLPERRRCHLLPFAVGIENPEKSREVLHVYVVVAIHITLTLSNLTHFDTNGE